MREKKIRDKNLMTWAVGCGAGMCVCLSDEGVCVYGSDMSGKVWGFEGLKS